MNNKGILGAIIGDIVGSTREHRNIKTDDFELLPKGSHFTDDTVMTLAVAEWLMSDSTHSEKTLVECMQRLGRKYPNAGYGGMFRQWLMSDNPQPYGSFGNGSAMRVSPIGMYANSLEEALRLARITACVTHNHPEGIMGALAIAACVYMKMQHKYEDEIKRYIEQLCDYDLNVRLEDIRDEYTFDVTCQGSVPIAIMAALQRYNTEEALRLAISMGGDSDTIGCMTCAIANAQPFYIWGGQIDAEIQDKCRELLPPDLLDINDRFMDFINKPLPQSYMVTGDGLYFAGEYPGDKDEERARNKIRHMVHFGVKHFINLTEEHELCPYKRLLPKGTTYTRFPIKDVCAPSSIRKVHRLLDKIAELKKLDDGYVYLHCWGGVGRTGTIVACQKARIFDNPTLEDVLTALRNGFSDMPKSKYRVTPESKEQIDFIKSFVDSSNRHKIEAVERVPDSIRGCLMAGAAGDALGYTVEFMSRKSILERYGKDGITQFDLDSNEKALISDDTQMTLFTANGMLMGLTRGYMRGIGGRPENYVAGAYLDWYYTQTGKKREILINDFHYTWLRDLPEMAHRRAPGNTCLSACESLFRQEEVRNNSKGCGGIMRVAPMGLLDAAYTSRGDKSYSLKELAEAGAEIARVTHKHALGFLPAALLTVLVYKLVPLSVDDIKDNINEIIEETTDILEDAYHNKFEEEKERLRRITGKAICLAKSDIPDAEAIKSLGEGWVAEEAWAIALFCSLRHLDSMKDAIIASVNHDGDSDSTGSITGNIMGAIYGYEAFKAQNLFCPNGHTFEETIELSEIILALADDLYTGCIISEYDPIDTPEKRQWYERYCEMKPAGIGGVR